MIEINKNLVIKVARKNKDFLKSNIFDSIRKIFTAFMCF